VSLSEEREKERERERERERESTGSREEPLSGAGFKDDLSTAIKIRIIIISATVE